MKNRRGIVPIISIILLLMMAVAAAAATFYWLTKMQGTLQGGTEQYQAESFEKMASTITITNVDYRHGGENLSIWLQNAGSTTIPVDNGSTDPTTRLELVHAQTGNVICSKKLNDLACSTGCTGDLEPKQTSEVQLRLNTTDCDLSAYANESMYYMTMYFSGKATASATFRVRSTD